MNNWFKYSLSFAAGLFVTAAVHLATNGTNAAIVATDGNFQPAVESANPDNAQPSRQQAQESTLGIATEKPSEQPYVKLADNKFMQQLDNQDGEEFNALI